MDVEVGEGRGGGQNSVPVGATAPSSPRRPPAHEVGDNSRISKSNGPGLSTRVENGQRRTGRGATREEYETALAAYLDHPIQVTVMNTLGCGQDIAMRLIHEGIPALGLAPLEDRRKEAARLAAMGEKRLARGTEKLTAEGVAKELEARKAAAEVAVVKQKAVLGDAIVQAEEEGRLIRANRTAALVLTGIQANLLRTGARLAGWMDNMIEQAEAAPGVVTMVDGRRVVDGKKALDFLGLKPRDVMGMQRSVAFISEKIAEASAKAIELERLRLGEPGKIIGVQQVGAASDPSKPPMSMEEAEKKATGFLRAMERWRAREARKAMAEDSEEVIVEAVAVSQRGEEVDDDGGSGDK